MNFKILTQIQRKMILFSSLILLFCFLSWTPESSNISSPRFNSQLLSVPLENAESTAIHVIGNSGWASFPQITGSGIQGNPYLIKDLHIDAMGVGDCIWIESSTAYFRIENCTLHNTTLFGDAIKIDTASNGVIINCTMYDTYYGVWMFGAANMVVQQNNMSYNHHGIRMFGNNFNITSNKIHHNTYAGIEVLTGSKAIIANNILTENNDSSGGNHGIDVETYSNVNITGNYIHSTRYDGIYLDTVSNAKIWNNTCIDNRHAIAVADCPTGGIVFNNNTMLSVRWNSIDISSSRSITFSNNTMQGGGFRFQGISSDIDTISVDTTNSIDGKAFRFYKNQNQVSIPANTGSVLLFNCNDTIVQNSNEARYYCVAYCRNFTLSQSKFNTIDLYRSTNSFLLNNNCSTNFKGIWITESHNNVISGNNCTQNRIMGTFGYGIYLYLSNNNNVLHNYIAKNNYFGIDSYSCNNNTISWNICINNWVSGTDGTGIRSSGSYSWGNTQVYNNYVSGSHCGMRIDSYYTIASNNTCTANKYWGIYAGGGGATALIINNTCNSNTNYGMQLSNNFGIARNNTCNSNTMHGITMTGDYVRVESNICKSNSQNGINWGTGAPHGYGINNICQYNGGQGIYLVNSQNTTLINNSLLSDGMYVDSSSDNSKLIGNSIKSTTSAYHGINIDTADNCQIINNSLISDGDNGIRIKSSINCTIIGNNCTSTTSGDGILLESANSNIVAQNNCSFNSGFGIYVMEGSSNNLVYENVGQDTIYISSGNTAYDNFFGNGPFAWFKCNATTINPGDSIKFFDKSFGGTGALTYQWNFTDGSANSTEKSPIHKFTVGGTYTVKLTVKDSINLYSYYSKIITVLTDTNPIASFSTNGSSIIAGQWVNFTDTTVNGDKPFEYQWKFGSDPINSTIPNPIYHFTSPGTFWVILTIEDTDGDISVCSQLITVAVDLQPTGSISANYSSLIIGEYIQLNFICSGGNGQLTLDWNFGDGTAHSNVTNPVHLYGSLGTKTVTLTITDIDGDQAITTAQITVALDTIPNALFNANITTVALNGWVKFTDATTNGNPLLTYQWKFGADPFNSTLQNPAYQFTTLGLNTVVLTVSDRNGNSSICSLGITVIDDLFPTASFQANATSIFENGCVQFTDASSGGNGVLSRHWNFGDGTANASSANPIHRFGKSGVYNVILTVTDEDGDTSSYSITIQVVNKPTSPSDDEPTDIGGEESSVDGFHLWIIIIGSMLAASRLIKKRNHTK